MIAAQRTVELISLRASTRELSAEKRHWVHGESNATLSPQHPSHCDILWVGPLPCRSEDLAEEVLYSSDAEQLDEQGQMFRLFQVTLVDIDQAKRRSPSLSCSWSPTRSLRLLMEQKAPESGQDLEKNPAYLA